MNHGVKTMLPTSSFKVVRKDVDEIGPKRRRRNKVTVEHAGQVLEMEPICGDNIDYNAVAYRDHEMRHNPECCYVHAARAQTSLIVRCPPMCYECFCCDACPGNPIEASACKRGCALQCVFCCRDRCGPCCNVFVGRVSACWRRLRFHSKVAYANVLFEPASVALVIVYTIALMTQHSPASDSYVNTMAIVNAVFLGIFCVELAVRLLAQGVRAIMYDRWLAFDVFIILTSVIVNLAPNFEYGVQAGRALRVARVLRFLHLSPQLRLLLNTLQNSAKPIFIVTVFLFMSLFFFAVVGMELYSEIAAERASPADYIRPYPNLAEQFNVSLDAGPDDPNYLAAKEAAAVPGNTPYEGFHRHAHFRTFGAALMTMLRAATGEDWQLLYHDCRNDTNWAPLFWFAFVVMVQMTVLSFFVGSVIQAFETDFQSSEKALGFGDVSLFKSSFDHFDKHRMNPRRGGYVRVKYIMQILQAAAGWTEERRLEQAKAETALAVARLIAIGKPHWTAPKFDKMNTVMNRAMMEEATNKRAKAIAKQQGGVRVTRSASDGGDLQANEPLAVLQKSGHTRP